MLTPRKKEQKEIIITVGVSGAGKSTWTKEFLKEHPDWLRINRDDIRRILFGDISPEYYTDPNLHDKENSVSRAENGLILVLMDGVKSRNLVIDNTHLKKEYIERIIAYCNRGSEPHIKYSFKIFDEKDPELLKDRVSKRDNLFKMKLSYIDKQIDSFKHIVEYINKNYSDKIIK